MHQRGVPPPPAASADVVLVAVLDAVIDAEMDAVFDAVAVDGCRVVRCCCDALDPQEMSAEEKIAEAEKLKAEVCRCLRCVRASACVLCAFLPCPSIPPSTLPSV